MIEFKTMLAHKTKDVDWSDGVGRFVQPKLDGVRCYTRLIDGEVKMFSRNHKEFHNAKHIATELKDLFRDNPSLIIDGELYNHKFRDNFNKIISLVRKSKPTQADRFESSSLLQYHVYDLFDPQNVSMDFIDRTLWLNMNIRGRSLKTVATRLVWSDKDVERFHKVNLKDGFEGSMLRKNRPYEQKRSWTLQKVKDFSDTEFIITGIVEGKGKFAGGLGKFLGTDLDGRNIEVPFQRCTIENRKKIFKEFKKKYLGKTATFEYFERTPDNAYRFPQFKALRNYE